MSEWNKYKNICYVVGGVFYLLAALNFTTVLVLTQASNYIIYVRPDFLIFTLAGIFFIALGLIIYYKKCKP